MPVADALTQAIGQAGTIQSAATDQSAPDAAAYDLETAKTNSANAEKRVVLQDKINQSDAVNAQPIAPLPKSPQFQDIPTTPPKLLPQNPMQTLAQFLPLMAALGGAGTKTSAIAALNASSNALDASQASDQTALKQAHEDWKSHMDATIQSNASLQQAYTDAINDHNLGWTDRLAKLAQIASNAGDKLALADLDTGNPQNIINRGIMLGHTADRLIGVVQGAQENDLKRQTLEEDTKYKDATLKIEQTKADAKIQPDTQQVIGGILAKLAAGETLSPSAQQALDTYGKWRTSGGGGGGDPFDLPAGSSVTIGAGATPAAGAPPAVPLAAAPPAAAPAPAAPAANLNAIPPAAVAKLKEGVMHPFANGTVWTLRGGKPIRVK